MIENNINFSYLTDKQPFYFKFLKVVFFYYCKFVFYFYTPLRVYNKDYIPDSSFILCSNHDSHMDVAILSASTNKSFNHFGMLAAKDYWFDNKYRRFFINLILNLIPIDRTINENKKFPIKDTLDLCKNFMNYHERNLILFPEGSRGVPGEIQPFKKGAASFSLNLNKPILPAVIHGTHIAWPKGKKFMRPVPIEVHILKPIYPHTFLKNKNPDENEMQEVIKNITRYLENKINKKVQEIYGK
ncbi:MAG: 1-acyl-sn-glycerol-3-phosphate acyltransferase [Candidatus Marinimicrobia bacterium]|nr:1-acyl-sn-glycerol-3-phosphate acyltransferase [Candidatus Neomarinimicrobiota bacterium]